MNKKIFGLFLILLLVLLGRTIEVPLLGSHQWRQADTNSMSYSFCYETKDIMRPLILMRGSSDGIAIGEFPLYNWLTGMSCRVFGGWSEALPKVISFIFMLSSAMIWGLVFANFGSPLFWAWMTLYCFSSLSFVFLNHALPEGLALLCIGLAAFLWRKSSRYDWLGTAFFCLGFLVRPYLVGLLFLSARARKHYLITMPFVLLAYAFWYKYWALQFHEPYFLVKSKPIMEALKELPYAVMMLFVHLAQLHLNWIALPLFIYGAIKNQKLFGLWVLSAFIVFMASGYHYDLHPYYLFATLVFGLVLVFEGLQKWNPSARVMATFLFAFGMIAITGRAYEFFAPQDKNWESIPRLIAEAGIGSDERITTADGKNPIWLYYAKRPGFAVEPGSVDVCESPSVAVLYKEANIALLKKCP